MNTFFIKFRKSKLGFTLIELIIVIAILAILAAILIPSLIKYIGSAEESSLIASCKTCVNAADMVISKDYTEKGTVDPVYEADLLPYIFDDLDGGHISGISVDKSGTDATYALDYLTLTDKDGLSVTYVREPEPHYVFSRPIDWALGDTYGVGDLMTANGFIFRCIRAHTTGTTSRTRNPSLRSNKSTWEVIGTVDGNVPAYSSTVRFAEGMEVIYKGKTYIRTNFNLVGGQVPYDDPPRDSDYWKLKS